MGFGDPIFRQIMTNLYPQYARCTDNSRLASAFTSSSRPRQYVLVADTQNPGEPFKHIQINLIRQLKNSWIMIFPANLVYMWIYIYILYNYIYNYIYSIQKHQLGFIYPH